MKHAFVMAVCCTALFALVSNNAAKDELDKQSFDQANRYRRK